MLYSMTAFGRSRVEAADFTLTVEIRALNSRNLDLVLRFPKSLLDMEDSCRKLVAQSVRRGRMEITVQLETKGREGRAPSINLKLARQYWEQLQEMHRSLPAVGPPRLEHLLSIPYLFDSTEVALERETLNSSLQETLLDALEQVRQMKAREGEALMKDCLQRLAVLRRELGSIAEQREQVAGELERRLRERLRQVLGEVPVDENRLLQELVYFAERSDINEELVRFQSHLDQMESWLTADLPADGRKLDFLLQEMHREANTLGAKMSDLAAIRSAMALKAEIGKLKEQIQNVE